MTRFPEYQPGDPLSAEAFNRTTDAGAQTHEQIDALEAANTPPVPRAQEFNARLTSEPSGGEYEFKEVRRDSAGANWEDLPGGLTSGSGSTNQRAREYNGKAGITTGANDGTVVRMLPVPDSQGGLRFLFIETESSATKIKALITGHASLATNRWKYAWSEAEWSGDTLQVKSGGLSGTTGGDYAVNMAEAYHDSQYAWGIDMNHASYSDTSFAPRPVGAMGDSDTHDKDVGVELTIEPDADGNTVRWFDKIWTHQGACS